MTTVPDRPEAPFFLIDGNDLVAYLDTRSLCLDVEPWMIDQRVEFLDVVGRPLRLIVGERRTHGVELADGTAHSDLREKLTRFLVTTGRPVPEDGDLRSFARAAAAVIAER